MRNILVIMPTDRDIRELRILNKKYGYNFLYFGKNPRDSMSSFDPLSFIQNVLLFVKENKIDAVIATHDYPSSIIGSIVAGRLSLPSPEIEKMLIFQHKYVCRKFQKKYVPEAYVASKLVDPFKKAKAPFDFPFFIKPVKSFFSIMAAFINDAASYDLYIEKAKKHIIGFSRPLDLLLGKYSKYRIGTDYFIAEKIISGKQVTLEAYVYEEKFRMIGIVDSVMHKNKISFKRFDYPSSLSRQVKNRMEIISKKLVESTGFNNGILNIEFFYDKKQDLIKIIEVNPRMCSQFADLMEKVNGINTHEIQLMISLGLNPEKLNQNVKYKHASSFVLRKFKDSKVKAFPSKKQLKNVQKLYPDSRIEIYGKEGRRLSEELNDMASFRYGIINIGANSKSELKSKYYTFIKMLDFNFF